MAHKKGGGTTKINKDSQSKRLGVKKFGGERVNLGNIILRQKGSKFYPGVGTKMGNDFTIFATSSGKVIFKKRMGKTLIGVLES